MLLVLLILTAAGYPYWPAQHLSVFQLAAYLSATIQIYICTVRVTQAQ